jgi:hypothetical protein
MQVIPDREFKTSPIDFDALELWCYGAMVLASVFRIFTVFILLQRQPTDGGH